MTLVLRLSETFDHFRLLVVLGTYTSLYLSAEVTKSPSLSLSFLVAHVLRIFSLSASLFPICSIVAILLPLVLCTVLVLLGVGATLLVVLADFLTAVRRALAWYRPIDLPLVVSVAFCRVLCAGLLLDFLGWACASILCLRFSLCCYFGTLAVGPILFCAVLRCVVAVFLLILVPVWFDVVVIVAKPAFCDLCKYHLVPNCFIWPCCLTVGVDVFLLPSCLICDHCWDLWITGTSRDVTGMGFALWFLTRVRCGLVFVGWIVCWYLLWYQPCGSA